MIVYAVDLERSLAYHAKIGCRPILTTRSGVICCLDCGAELELFEVVTWVREGDDFCIAMLGGDVVARIVRHALAAVGAVAVLDADLWSSTDHRVVPSRLPLVEAKRQTERAIYERLDAERKTPPAKE